MIQIKILKKSYILVDKGDMFECTDDAVFSSPSGASSMVLGRNSNGFTEWVTDKGLTFKQVQEMLNKVVAT